MLNQQHLVNKLGKDSSNSTFGKISPDQANVKIKFMKDSK